MCAKCETVVALLLLDEAETELLAAQAEDRLAPAAAVRPLFDHEVRAQTRFADVEDMLDSAVEEAALVLAALHEQVRATILAALFGAAAARISPAEAVTVLDGLAATRPEAVASAMDSAADELTALFATTYTLSSRLVIEEAARQGAVAQIGAQVVDDAVLAPQGRAVAAHPWQRILTKLQQELTRPAVLMQETITADEVQAVLDTVKIDGSRDLAKQSINTAAGMGRIDTADELEPSQIYASEILDGETCERCAATDGRDYATLEEARQDYPLGTNARCAGGARCRGTLVFIYETD